MEALLSSPLDNLLNSTVSGSGDDIHLSPRLLLLGPLAQLLGSVLLLPWVPAQVRTSTKRTHKWRSTFLARISAGISGILAVFTLQQSFPLRADLMYGSSQMAVDLIMLSLGIHIAETMDMIIIGNFSLLSVHHLAVIATFAGALLSNKAIGFAVLTLVTELNAVTNKTRILHIISDTNTLSLEYRINAYVNIVTFFMRILVIFWMNNQSILYFVDEPCVFYGVCSIGILFVNMWNLTVFKTLFIRDILQKPKEH